MQEKRLEVMKAIKPICDAFGIRDYDYEIKETGQRETLRIGDVRIGCSSNSIGATVDELIGYIFIARWCKNRYLGTFSTQCKNVIRQHWI